MRRAVAALPRTVTGVALISVAGIAVAGIAVVGPARATSPGRRTLSILYTAEVHGAVEPCGCTSDPLGDISRLAHVARLARKETGAVLLVDAGDLLYPQGAIPAKKRDAWDLRAEFLAEQLARMGLGGAAVGESDLPRGPERARPRRLASNLAAPFVDAPRVQTIGGVKVAIIGVAEAALGRAHGWKTEDPIAAARRDAERLRKDGAEVVLVLAAVDRTVARRIARDAPVDFVVLGRQVGKGMPRAEAVGSAYIVAPGEELQHVGRIDIVLREPGAAGGLKDAGGAEARRLRVDELDRALKSLDADLERWNKGGAGGDAAFIAAKRRERDALAAERQTLASAGAWAPPPSGSYFTNQLIPLRRSLPRDAGVVAAMKQLDAKIGAAYLRAAQAPPTAEPGRATYVGDAKCVKCHKRAANLWKRTVHARAWKTLVDGRKAADPECVMCHVVGFDQVGGSTIGFTKGLENVQCESCHGPASIHVAELGTEEPPSMKRDTPESTCTACHSEKHSDTFQYEAYLRDVLGPGHGEERRSKLGDGPTGKRLRAAAVAKAKAAGKAQLKEM